MTIHFLNGFTCNARVPASWQTGTVCLLIETKQGLVLVDAGVGSRDFIDKPGILRVFQIITKVPLKPEEPIVRQLARLGFAPEDVRHIVLTHMHFDHCGGLPDFPQADVHVHAREYAAYSNSPHKWRDLAYVKAHTRHKPHFELYEAAGESWLGFPAIRLLFDPEMWLVPLFGHSAGHCGVAVKTEEGWLFHAGDAGPVGLESYAPDWLIRFVLGPHVSRLRAFQAAHPEVTITTGHMWLDFFE